MTLPASFRAGMVLAALLTPLGSTMIAVALPDLGRELGAEAATLHAWLVLSYLLVSVVGQAPGGALADRVGHGRALAAGIGLFGTGTALAAAAPSLPGIAAGRVLMAAGGAITLPAATALLRVGIPPGRRMRAFGLFGAALGLAAAAGPLAGAVLVACSGPRAVFLAPLPILAVAAALLLVAPRVPRLPAPVPSGRFGGPGGALGLDLRAWRAPAFASGGAVIGLQNLVTYGLLFHLPHAIGSAEAGRVLPGMLGGMLAGSPLGGWAAGRWGARRTVLAGGAASLAGLALLPVQATAALALLGLGVGACTAPAQASALESVPAARAGAAAGTLSTARYLGGMAGVALPGAPVVILPVLALAALAGLALPGRRRVETAAAAREAA